MQGAATTGSMDRGCIQGDEVQTSLKLAAEGRATLSIHSEGVPLFTARLIHLYQRMLIIDQIDRPAVAGELPTGQVIDGQVMIHGRGLYVFRSVWGGRVSSGGRYGLVLPPIMKFLQRREFIRIEPVRSMPAEVISMFGKAVLPHTKVENISLGGVCLSFPRESPVRVGMEIPQIRLVLNRLHGVCLDGLIRGKWKARYGRFDLGIQWKKPIFSTLEVIKRYVVDVQRLELRRRR